MISAHHIKPIQSLDEFSHHLLSTINVHLQAITNKPKTQINHSHLTPLQNQILNMATNNDLDVRGTNTSVFVNGLRGIANEEEIR